MLSGMILPEAHANVLPEIREPPRPDWWAFVEMKVTP
jgi:hypothetical protein